MDARGLLAFGTSGVIHLLAPLTPAQADSIAAIGRGRNRSSPVSRRLHGPSVYTHLKTVAVSDPGRTGDVVR